MWAKLIDYRHWKWGDVVLHGLVGLAMTGVILWGRWGIPFAVAWAGLYRELSQENKSDILAAFRTLPDWDFRGHAEWVIYGLVSAAVVWIWPW